ncbi:ATP-dependent helicase, putative [Babesia bigemina]|uniref:ATP-dependent helicase, putative n=1 Tax=Babesia bigemina TaxID=5866 RepID=A0A061DET0_BABBI|nr:ATP-dependent helicase, putative [Babesia bigemina]CDR97815.1 ATP-dependent helicase, putative [Babesia bigemina]|eukprot:XP_012770001.1 ATP-dependent helicase, putative [Babesia bigemina]
MANAILSQRDEIVAAVEGHNVVAFSGPTESYASSYIPSFLYKAGFTSSSNCRKNPPRICVAHSRHQEVKSSAESCSVLINNPSKVACHLGSAASLDSTADIVYVTEDCLLRRLVADPLLSDYGVVILTGLQDRLLCTEILLALLKRILSKRSRLRIVLIFEGGNVDDVLTFFRRRATEKDTAAETSPSCGDEVSKPNPGSLLPLGDVYHVHLKCDSISYKVQYLSAPCPNYLDAAVSTVWSICRSEPSGNVLVFVPSSEELELLHTNLLESAKSFREQGAGSLNVVPLGVGGSTEQHIKKNPYASRNIYICCDLKDYRSKVDSIRYVVDCGFSRRMVSDHVNTGSVACTVTATRDEMRRRSNIIRGSGKCYRLLTEAHFMDNSLVMEFPISEMKTTDLTTMILFIKSLGVADFSDFEFVVQPPIDAIEHALTTLFLLGAIDGNGDVVYPCGNVMAELPYTAMLSNFLYRSTELGCSAEALTICAMLEVQDIVLKRGNVKSTYQTERLQAAMRGFAASEGDLFSYFNVYQLARYYRDEDSKWLGRHMVSGSGIRSAEKIRSQLAALLKKYQLPEVSCGDNSAVLLEAVFKSFFLNVACKEHLVRTLLTSRHLDVGLKVKSKVLDDEGNAILTNELQPYLLVASLDTSKTRRLYIHSGSFLADEQPDWVVFNESMDIDGEYFMRDVTAIQPEFLQKYAPHYYGEVQVRSYLTDN